MKRGPCDGIFPGMVHLCGEWGFVSAIFGPVSVYPPKGGLILEAATFTNDLGLEKDCCAGIAVT